MASALSQIKSNSSVQLSESQAVEKVLGDFKKLLGKLLTSPMQTVNPIEYKNYFTAYAKAVCFSPPLRVQDLRACVLNIEKLDKNPELTKISTVMFAVIAHITMCSVMGKRLSSLKETRIASVQQQLSHLLFAKEIVLISYYKTSIQDQEQHLRQKRNNLAGCVVRCRERKSEVLDFGLLENSEAFALFCRYGHWAKESGARTGFLRTAVLTGAMIQDLERYKSTSNIHLSKIANVILVMDEHHKIFEKNNRAEAIWQQFIEKTLPTTILSLVGKLLAPFAPEAEKLWDITRDYGESFVKALKDDPENEELPEKYFADFRNIYKSLEASGTCELAYEVFYGILQGLSPKTSFDLCQYSQYFKNKLPTPEEFKQFSYQSYEAGVLADLRETQIVNANRKKPKKARSQKTRTGRAKVVKYQSHRKNRANAQIKVEQQKQDVIAPPQKQDIASPPAIAVTPFSLPKIKSPVVPVATPISLFEQIAAESTYPVDALMYAPRVNLWFENSKAALDNAQQRGMNQMYRDEWVMFHTLPQFLDRLIGTLYCIEGECENQKGEESDLFSFIGEIVDSSGKASRGVLSIAVDETGVCWHRCWSKKTTSELVNQRTAGALFNIDNPTPAEAALRTGNVKPRRELVDRIEVTMSKAGVMSMPISKEYTLRLFPCHPN